LCTGRKEFPTAKYILAALKAYFYTVRKEVPTLKNISATLKAHINVPERENFFKKSVEEDWCQFKKCKNKDLVLMESNDIPWKANSLRKRSLLLFG
jgi:hypothetical protein